MDETLASADSSPSVADGQQAPVLPASPASPASTDAAGPSREPPKSAAQRAFEKAQARQAKASTESQPTPTDGAAPQSPTPEQATQGDSTPGGDKPKDETGTSAAEPVSTPLAPQHWDAKLKEAFDGIPTDSGKSAMLEVYKNLQGPFTQGMQALKARETELDALVQLHTAYQQDPKAVLQQIADSAGVSIWFDQPAPAGEVPDFQNPADLARWAKAEAKKEALAELQASTRKEIDEFRTAQARDKAAAEFTAELSAAQGKFPDFVQHKDGILHTLDAYPALPVEMAYMLTTYPGIAKRAAEGDAAIKELKELKAQIAAKQANAMRPTNGQAGDIKPTGNGKTDPKQAAFERAQRIVAQRQASAAS